MALPENALPRLVLLSWFYFIFVVVITEMDADWLHFAFRGFYVEVTPQHAVGLSNATAQSFFTRLSISVRANRAVEAHTLSGSRALKGG